MIAPRPRAVVGERQPVGERVHHGERLQQSLRIPMQPCDLLGVRLRASSPARVCGGSAARRWIARVWSRSSSTVSTRQRFSSSSSTSIAVVVRTDRRSARSPCRCGSPACRVAVSLPVTGDGQFTFGLQEFECVGGPLAPSSSAMARTLCARSVSPDVEQRLAGHRRKPHQLLTRHEPQHRIHQRGSCRPRTSIARSPPTAAASFRDTAAR